jgi:Tol biopolymer transport system component
MSADASVVLFRSSATDITPGFSNNSTDLFIWTRADRTLKRLSLPGGIVARPPQFVHITNPVLSEEGRFLAFRATTSGTTVTALDGVWVWDLSAGTGVLARNDRAGTGVLGQDDLSGPVMSRDGQILAFEVNEGVVTRPTRKIKAWTAATGLQSLESLVTGDPATAPDPESSEMPVLDADGSRLAFLSRSAVPGTPVTGSGTNRLFVRDLATGSTVVFPAGEAAEAWDLPFAEFIGNGSRLVFQSEAPLAADAVDANRALDVFTGFPGTFPVTAISLADDSASVTAPAAFSMMPRDGAGISASGRYVLYGSPAQDVLVGAANPGRDVFRFDHETGTTLRVSRAPDAAIANGPSTPIALSADGRIALFLSLASNLVTGDTNGVEDLFRADLQTGVVELVNAKDGGTEFSQRAPSGLPQLSGDGRYVAFLSPAVDLVSGMSGSGTHLFLRDTELRKTYWVNAGNTQGSAGTVRGFAMGASGRYLAFASGNPTSAGVAVYDRQAGGRVPLPAGLTSHVIALSEARDTVAFVGLSEDRAAVAIQGVALATGARSEWIRLPAASIVRSLRFSADGGALLFVTAAPVPSALTGIEDTNGSGDAYLYDFAKASVRLCSVEPSGQLGRGHVDQADLSDDGRWVVFRSNPPYGAGEWLPEPAQVYAHEVATGRTTLLSAEPPAGLPGNGPSSVPGISGDGRVVVYASAATGLATDAHDGNGGADIWSIRLNPGGDGDLDGDGLPDAWETLHLGGLSETGSGDLDRDGQSNSSEYQAGTNPSDPGSLFRIELRSGQGAVLQVEWPSFEGVIYSVEFTKSLDSTGFAPVPPEIRGDGSRKSVPVPLMDSEGYYRVRARRDSGPLGQP